MAALTGLTIIKKFEYRGDASEEWSNHYHLRNSPPLTEQEWESMALGLIDLERRCYPATSQVIRAYGYDDDSPTATSVWSFDYEAASISLPGQLTLTGSRGAGDQAAMVWWKMDQKNSRGKWIYLRKYVHDPDISLTDADSITASQKAALELFAQEMTDGTAGSWGGIRAQKFPDAVIAYAASQWVTTRTLKRRGKRPLVQTQTSSVTNALTQ